MAHDGVISTGISLSGPFAAPCRALGIERRVRSQHSGSQPQSRGCEFGAARTTTGEPHRTLFCAAPPEPRGTCTRLLPPLRLCLSRCAESLPSRMLRRNPSTLPDDPNVRWDAHICEELWEFCHRSARPCRILCAVMVPSCRMAMRADATGSMARTESAGAARAGKVLRPPAVNRHRRRRSPSCRQGGAWRGGGAHAHGACAHGRCPWSRPAAVRRLEEGPRLRPWRCPARPPSAIPGRRAHHQWRPGPRQGQALRAAGRAGAARAPHQRPCRGHGRAAHRLAEMAARRRPPLARQEAP